MRSSRFRSWGLDRGGSGGGCAPARPPSPSSRSGPKGGRRRGRSTSSASRTTRSSSPRPCGRARPGRSRSTPRWRSSSSGRRWAARCTSPARPSLAERALAEELFDQRDLLHQLQTVVSRQGEPIDDLDPLRDRLAHWHRSRRRLPACPPDWGALRVRPEAIELWSRIAGPHPRAPPLRARRRELGRQAPLALAAATTG